MEVSEIAKKVFNEIRTIHECRVTINQYTDFERYLNHWHWQDRVLKECIYYAPRLSSIDNIFDKIQKVIHNSDIRKPDNIKVIKIHGHFIIIAGDFLQ